MQSLIKKLASLWKNIQKFLIICRLYSKLFLYELLGAEWGAPLLISLHYFEYLYHQRAINASLKSNFSNIKGAYSATSFKEDKYLNHVKKFQMRFYIRQEYYRENIRGVKFHFQKE